MSLEENKALARRLYEEVFGQGNLDAADGILAPGCVTHGPGLAPTIGTELIKRVAVILRTGVPDVRVTLEDQFGEEDRVASRWTFSGTHTGPLAMISGGTVVAPTGGSIAFEEIRVDRFADDRIVELWFMRDRMTLWQQIGLFATS